MLGYRILFLLFAWLALVYADKPHFEISTPGDQPTTSSDNISSGAPDENFLVAPTDIVNDKLLANALGDTSMLDGDIIVVVVNLNNQVATSGLDSTDPSSVNQTAVDLNADTADSVITTTVTVQSTVTTTVTGSKQDTVSKDNPKDQNADPTNNPSPDPQGTDSSSNLPKDWRDQMLTQVNKLRTEVGKPPLKIDERANKEAQNHSDYQNKIGEMTHSGLDSGLGERADNAGFKGQHRALAENVAWNQRSVDEVMTSWRNSPGHYNNIIGDYNICGFGENNWYWTQEFLKITE